MKRRNLLKTIGIGVGSAAGVGTVGAAGKSGKGKPVDTGFDPSKQTETAQFIYTVFERAKGLSAEKTDRLSGRLADALSSAQKEAVAEYIQTNAKFETTATIEPRDTSSDATTSDVSANAYSFGSYDYTVNTHISLYLCPLYLCSWYDFHAYSYTHELEWFFDGDTVCCATASTSGSGNNYALVKWSYKGTSDSFLTYHPDDLYARSFRQGHFVQSILLDGFFDVDQYPEIELLGDQYGYGNVVSTEYK